jgi:hypothetical protein
LPGFAASERRDQLATWRDGSSFSSPAAPLQRRILGRIARRLVAELRGREQAPGLALFPPGGGGPDDEA